MKKICLLLGIIISLTANCQRLRAKHPIRIVLVEQLKICSVRGHVWHTNPKAWNTYWTYSNIVDEPDKSYILYTEKYIKFGCDRCLSDSTIVKTNQKIIWKKPK